MNADSHPASAPSKDTATKPLYYAALMATTVVALMYVFSALRGHPMGWPQTAFLVALCCISVNGFMSSRTMRMVLSIVGVVFACVAIYGFIAR